MNLRTIVALAAVTLVTLVGCAHVAQPASSAPANAQTVSGHSMLAPLAHWAGGRYVGTFESGGRRFTVVRTYAWSFDGRVLVGKSFGERDGKLVQSRETIYFWNPETKRIEFSDYIDTGGVGLGWLDMRDGQIYMDVKVVGNPGHPSWRAWITDDADTQTIRVEALRDSKWVDFGTYPYRRER